MIASGNKIKNAKYSLENLPHQDDVEAFYGKIGENQERWTSPYELTLAWDKKVKIKSFYCHKLIHQPLTNIFKEVLEVYGMEKIKELGLDIFGGCFNKRFMRGGTRYSMHSWGIAIDIDPINNQLKWDKNKAKLARSEYDKFWEIVYNHGGISLGKEKNYDWMHFQFAKV